MMCEVQALTNGDHHHPPLAAAVLPEAGGELEAENLPRLHSFTAKEVAAELTLLDAGLLRMIKTSELEDGVWMKKNKVCFQLLDL